MARVFISYRHNDPDRAIASALCSRLSEAGHEVFFDAEDIRVGDLWDGKIREKLEGAEYFIPLISSGYFSSKYILRRELKVAWRLLVEKRLKQILPVNVAYDGNPPEDVREAVSQVQHLKWKGEDDTDDLCQQMVARLPAPEELVKGMRAFVYADSKLFAQLGREKEVADFTSLLGDSRSPYVLLHGVSGSGKTSFLSAGVLPALGAPSSAIAELTEDAAGSFGALAASGSPLLILDQFEQSLIRFAQDPARCRAFEDAAGAWVAGGEGRRLIFCLRDEYRTPFDTMLPRVASRCRDAQFALLPLRPDAAAHVLGLLLKNAGVECDAKFLEPLCEGLAGGVPKSVLPALLQMVAQYWRSPRRGRLDKGVWERLNAGETSVFREHVREAVLERLPRKLTLEAAQSLWALAEGPVKTHRKSAEEIAADHGLSPEVVRRTLETAAQPHARVVAAEAEADDQHPHYRLIHDLFVPAIHALRREAQFEREGRNRRRLLVLFGVLSAAALSAAALAYIQSRAVQRQRNEAVARQLAAQSNALRAGDGGSFMRSMLFAAEAHRRFPTVESAAAVRAALALSPLHVARLGHEQKVRAQPQFSRDGTMLAAGGEAGKVRVWDFGSRQLLADFDTGLPVTAVAFSHDGRTLAAGAGFLEQDRAGGVSVAWDVRDGRELVRVESASPVTAVAFVRDTGRLIAVTPNSAQVLSPDGSPPLTIEFDQSEGHPVTALSRDGGLLAVGTGATVKVYELPSGRPVSSFRAGESAPPAQPPKEPPSKEQSSVQPPFGDVLVALAFSADGKRLAAELGAEAIVWNLASSRPPFRAASGPAGGRSVVNDLSVPDMPSFLTLSDDGALVASTNNIGMTRVWEVGRKGDPIAVIEPNTRAFSVFSVRVGTVFRPGSHDLFTPTGGSTMRMHRLVREPNRAQARSGAFEVLRLAPGINGLTAPLTTSPDGRFAVSVDEGNLDVWELKTAAAEGEAPRVSRTAFSPSGRFFIARKQGGGLEVFNLAEGGGPYMTLEAGAELFAVSADDRLAVTVKAGSFLIDFINEKLFSSLMNGRFSLGSADASVVEIYDLKRRARVGRVNCGDEVKYMFFSSDGQSVLCSTDEGLLRRAGEVAEVLKEGEGSDVTFSPSGRYFTLISSGAADSGAEPSKSSERVLEVFETAGRRKVLSTPLEVLGFEFAFSGDEKYLIARVEKNSLAVWETEGWRMLRRFPANWVLTKDAAVWGDSLLAVAIDKNAFVWNLRTGAEIARLYHDSGRVQFVAFDPTDGRHVLTTCDDGKVHVWDVDKGSEETVIDGVEPNVKAVFSPDGKYLSLVGRQTPAEGGNNVARVLLWRREDLIGEVCRRVARNFNADEWRLYTGFVPDAPTCPNLP